MEQISELETIFPPHGSGWRGWCAGLAFYLVPSILVSCLAPLPLLEASGALRITMRNKLCASNQTQVSQQKMKQR